MAWYREEDGSIITDAKFQEDCCNCTGFCAEGNISVPCNGEKADCPHYHKLDVSDYDKEIRAKAITEFAEKMKKKYPIAECGFGLMNDRLHENIDEIAKELKGE